MRRVHHIQEELSMKKSKMGVRSRRKLILEMASKLHENEGTLEIDSNAKLSEGDDNGTYVQAWVWVPFAGTVLCKGEDGLHVNCEDGCPIWDKAVESAL
jgi:hypothetical protein